MNDLCMITEVGQQRSRMTRLIITTARRFLASKNQFQLAILVFGYLGHRLESFSPKQHTHTYVGQIKVNYNKVICQMSMKLHSMFDQKSPHTRTQIEAKHIPVKNDLKP